MGEHKKTTMTTEEAKRQERKYRSKAEEYANDSERLNDLLEKASKKAEEMKGPLGEAIDKVLTLMRLIRAYIKGDYKEIPWETLVSAIVALLYFLSPVDLIPDFIPVLGMVDDAIFIAWIYKSISADIEKFRAWENERCM